MSILMLVSQKKGRSWCLPLFKLVKHACSIPSWGLTALLCEKVTKQLDFLCTSGMARLHEHSTAAVLIPFCITLQAVNCPFFSVQSTMFTENFS